MKKMTKLVTTLAIAIAALVPAQAAFAQTGLTIKEVHVVDGKDGVTPVVEPYVGQVMQANLKMSDDTWIYSYPANPNVVYKWYDVNSGSTLGTASSFTYTDDNVGMEIALDVEYNNNGEIVTWKMGQTPTVPPTDGTTDGTTDETPGEVPGEAPANPKTADDKLGGIAAVVFLVAGSVLVVFRKKGLI